MRPVRELLERLFDWVNPDHASQGTMDEGEALRAAEKVKKSIGSPPWLERVGVGYSAFGGFYVMVVAKELTDKVWNAVPSEIDGIMVRPIEARNAPFPQAEKQVPAQFARSEAVDLLSDLAVVVEDLARPGQAEQVAKILRHRFGKNGWFISAKPTRSGNGVRLNIHKPYGKKPTIPKMIHGVPVRVEKKRVRPQAPAQPVPAVPTQELPAKTEERRRIVQELAPVPGTAGTPPGNPSTKKPGQPPVTNPINDPAVAPAAAAALDASLKYKRLIAKNIAKATPGDALPSPDEKKAADDADKTFDALKKLASTKGLQPTALQAALNRGDVPRPTGTVGGYQVKDNRLVYRAGQV